MSLANWEANGWLKPEPASRDEIRSLLAIVDRDLKDAAVEAVSEDRRFEAAFNAGRTAATMALRASGYRTSVQTGHHMKTIESLEFTIAAEQSLIRRMSALRERGTRRVTIPLGMSPDRNWNSRSRRRSNFAAWFSSGCRRITRNFSRAE